MKKTLLLFAVSVFTIFSCEKDESQKEKNLKDTFNIENGKISYMFNNNEPNSILTDESKRSFNPKCPVQISITSNQEFMLRSFSPRQLKDAKIWATISGYPNDEFLLASFDILPPFVEYTKKLPFLTEDSRYTTKTGKTIIILANPYISDSDIKLRFECSDPLWKKYQSIKFDGRIKFSNYQWKDGHKYWRDIKPVICREACAMSINSAYMFSSQRYIDEMKKFDGSGNFGRFVNGLPTDARTGKIDDMLKAVEGGRAYFVDINSLIESSQKSSVNTRWGRLVGVGGLGGGNVVGLGGGSFVNHYGDDDGGAMAWFHELGHCMNFGDATNTVISWGTLGKSEKDGKEYFAWRYICQELYVKMCVDKELPIYSKYFLNSRQHWFENANDSFKFYAGGRGNFIDIPADEAKWFAGKFVDLKEKESDPQINKGEAVTFEINYETAKYTSKEQFKPHRLAVYGDKLYVLERIDKDNCALNVFDISNGTPKHEANIVNISYTTIEQSGNDSEYKEIVHNEKLNNVRDIYRSYDKIYINYHTPGKILVLNDKYEYVDVLAGTVTSGLIANKGFIYGIYTNVVAIPESCIGEEIHTVASMGLSGQAHDNNRLTIDTEGNMWTVQYTAQKICKVNTQHISKGRITTDKTISFANAQFEPSAVCFIGNNKVIATGWDKNKKRYELARFDISADNAVKEKTFNEELKLNNKSATYCITGRNTLFLIDDIERKVIAFPISNLL